MRSLVAIICTVRALAWTPAADGQSSPGWNDDVAIDIDGTARYYRYFVPSERMRNPTPAVIFLHGGGSSMRESMPPNQVGSAAWPDVAEANGFVLIVPNGVNRQTGDAFGDEQQWNDCRDDPAGVSVDDVAFLRGLVEHSTVNLDIDPTRIYFTGSSNGGMMTYRIATEAPEIAAAGAAFIANQPIGSECGDPSTPFPIMIANGTADPLMPYDGGVLPNGSGAVESTAATVALWRHANRATGPSAAVAFPDIDVTDGSLIERIDHPSPSAGAPVRLLRMVGAGHSIPSRDRRLSAAAELFVGPQNHDIEGAAVAWEFLSGFAAYPAIADGQWVNADPAFAGAGQGLTFDYLPSAGTLFIAWFSYALGGGEVDQPGAVGAPDNRWLTAQLAVSGDVASGPVFASSGGAFDSPPRPGQATVEVGSMTIEFSACDRAFVSYRLNEPVIDGAFSVKPLEARATGSFRCPSGSD
jgi:polyhydroxybutyrate depolymerase